MTHTPGPWHHGVDLARENAHLQINSDTRFIADVSIDWSEETKANARLIAAAPTMAGKLLQLADILQTAADSGYSLDKIQMRGHVQEIREIMEGAER